MEAIFTSGAISTNRTSLLLHWNSAGISVDMLITWQPLLYQATFWELPWEGTSWSFEFCAVPGGWGLFVAHIYPPVPLSGHGGAVISPAWVQGISLWDVSDPKASSTLSLDISKQNRGLTAPAILSLLQVWLRLFFKVRYVPKVPTAAVCLVILRAFCPPPNEKQEQERLYLLCRFHALKHMAWVHFP